MSNQKQEKRYSWTSKKQEVKQESILQEKDLQFIDVKKGDALLPEEEEHQIDSLAETRKKVEKKMPKAFEFTNRGEMLEKGEYSYKDGKTSKKAKRKVRDKSSMKAVVDGLKKLDDILACEIDLSKTEVLRDAFLDVCLACETYINKKNPYTAEGKARKQMVTDFYEQVSWESMRFSEIIEGYRGRENELAGRQWIDVLTDVRVEEYEDGKNGVKVEMGGAGTSEVFIIEKNGEKQYFKEMEGIPKADYGDLIKDKFEEYKNQEIVGKTEEERRKNQNKHDRRVILIKAVQKALNFHYLDIHEFKADFSKCTNKTKMLELIFTLKPFSYIDEDKGEYYNAEAEEEAEDYDFLSEYFFGIRKNYVLGAMATRDAMIDKKETLTKRNVAASRLAKMLGIGDVIVKSKMVDLIVGGEKKRGVLMEEAKGDQIGHYMNELSRHAPGEKVRYSTTALKQICCLQIFDLICGQIDRHDSNYICDIEQKENGYHEIKGIKGIDNDLAFGKLKYKDILEYGKNGRNRLKNIEENGSLRLLAVDVSFAQKICALKAEVIDYQMCDILNKEERLALIDRLIGVQRALRKRLKFEKDSGITTAGKSVFMEGENEWKMRQKQLAGMVEKIDDKLNDMSAYSYMKPILIGDYGAKNPAYLKKISLKNK